MFSADRGDPFDRLLNALSAAEDTLSRLDARVERSELVRGWRARIVHHEVVAWRWNRGEAASLDEVVLHAAHLGQQAPEASVSAALGALARRRRAAGYDAEAMGRWETVTQILRRRAPRDRSPTTEALLAATAPRRTPANQAPGGGPPPLLGVMNWPACPLDQDAEVFQAWTEAASGYASFPPVLRAAASLDHWMTIQPLIREDDLGALIVEARLRQAGRLRATPLLVELGRRVLSRKGRYWSAGDSAVDRAAYWLDAMAAGANAGSSEMDLLSIARQRLDQVLAGRRSSSRLPALAELLLRSPVVSANMVVDDLRVTPQAARLLMAELEGVVRETTGRSSYRIWRL